MRRGQSTWFLRNQVAGSGSTPPGVWGGVQQLRDQPEAPYGTTDQPPLMPVRINPAVVHLPEACHVTARALTLALTLTLI